MSLRDGFGWRTIENIHLSSLSFLSHSFFLSFLFFFHINFGPAGPLKQERERGRVGCCGLFLCFLIGKGVRGVSMFLLALDLLLAAVLERERERERVLREREKDEEGGLGS